jgi:hypothetical protein
MNTKMLSQYNCAQSFWWPKLAAVTKSVCLFVSAGQHRHVDNIEVLTTLHEICFVGTGEVAWFKLWPMSLGFCSHAFEMTNSSQFELRWDCFLLYDHSENEMILASRIWSLNLWPYCHIDKLNKANSLPWTWWLQHIYKIVWNVTNCCSTMLEFIRLGILHWIVHLDGSNK